MGLKKTGLLLLLILASFLSTSFAGRRYSNIVSMSDKGEKATYEDMQGKQTKMRNIHKRLLKVNTKDYGTYDPAPALVRPPFKLIPN